MKRFFISLITAIACGAGVMAQENWIATLQHGSDIQAFYGEDALSAAHEAAVDGDIITLSAGEFNGLEVTKAITLRGEGTEKTHIKTRITFTIPEKSTHTLFLEGLNISPTRNLALNTAMERSYSQISMAQYVHSQAHM